MEVTDSSLIKVLIVDDEVLARNRIREILKKGFRNPACR